MLAVVSLLTIYLKASLLTTTEAVNPACECVFYEGFGPRSNGTFMSPNYPVPYDADILCLLYTFVANKDEIIELTFHNFQLQPRELSGKCLDFIRLFQDLEEPAVNEASKWQAEFCGFEIAQETKFYSKGRALIFEFHSDAYHNPTTDRGFIGTFRFLDKGQYQTAGKLIKHTPCYYHIRSNNDLRKGSLFSPDYPFYYPSNSFCYYWFEGQPGERIRITMKEIDLPLPEHTCLQTRNVVLVYDGQNMRYSNSRNVATEKESPKLRHRKEKQKKEPTLIGRFCGQSSLWESVISSDHHAYMEFRSGPNENHSGRGFYAEFEFLSKLPFPAKIDKLQVTTPFYTAPFQKGQPCNVDVSSMESVQGGVITSPNYPNPYPPDMKCTYTFLSKGIERIQLVFTEFNLYLPTDTNYPKKKVGDCRDDNDHFTVYIELDNRMSEIDTFCGAETPPQIMSSRNSLTAEFVSYASRSGNASTRAFRFMYKFVTDFGITAGRKDPAHVCGFIYNSSDASNGTIYSPNYPGFYPRKTDCHYEFHGEPGEKIRIFFTYFDVEGYSQCDNDSQSDYIIFSNFQTEDRKNQRYCGVRFPKVQESELNYYRMIFHSNSIFDGTGFFALYQFTRLPQAALKSVKPPSSASTFSISLAILPIMISEALFMFYCFRS